MTGETNGRRAPRPTTLRIALGAGFRGHTVVIVVNGREVYRRADVTTDAMTAQADVVTTAVTSPTARLAVSVHPGELLATLDLDLSRHGNVAISLVGEATVSIETYGT